MVWSDNLQPPSLSAHAPARFVDSFPRSVLRRRPARMQGKWGSQIELGGNVIQVSQSIAGR